MHVRRKQPFTTPRRGALHLVVLSLIVALAIALGWATFSLPFPAAGLTPRVLQELPNSGVSNPVTAVLLNFRGYDTLLEVAVLLSVVVSSWSLGTTTEMRSGLPPDPLLPATAGLLIPLMILAAGYLLWRGSHAPGGAFQAGAILGAAGVFSVLADLHVSWLRRQVWLRVILSAGLGAFLAVAGGLHAAGYRLLEYPPEHAGILILAIESGATFAIGLTLALLFIGGRPVVAPEHCFPARPASQC